jgi:hypothetical protein
MELKTCHDVRQLTVCTRCKQVTDQRHSVKTRDGHWHGRCYVEAFGEGELLKLPQAELHKLTLGDVGGATMHAILNRADRSAGGARMNQCPTLGARVRYPGGTVVGPCTGTVVAIYEEYRYAEVDDNASDEELRRARRELLPERQWQVSVKVDAIPQMWCYTGTDRFAPQVSTLTRCSTPAAWCTLHNKAMQRKLKQHRAIDLSLCERTIAGDYVLVTFDDGRDYCDATAEAWIGSIGKLVRPLPSAMATGERRVLEPGVFLASTTARFYAPNEETPLRMRVAPIGATPAGITSTRIVPVLLTDICEQESRDGTDY